MHMKWNENMTCSGQRNEMGYEMQWIRNEMKYEIQWVKKNEIKYEMKYEMACQEIKWHLCYQMKWNIKLVLQATKWNMK